MSALQKYPRISDMVMPAARRLPAFVHAYLAAGTGQGQAMARNEAAYADIHLMPRFLRGRVTPDTHCSVLEKPIPLHLVYLLLGYSPLSGRALKNSVPCSR